MFVVVLKAALLQVNDACTDIDGFVDDGRLLTGGGHHPERHLGEQGHDDQREDPWSVAVSRLLWAVGRLPCAALVRDARGRGRRSCADIEVRRRFVSHRFKSRLVPGQG